MNQVRMGAGNEWREPSPPGTEGGPRPSTLALRSGRILTGFVALFLLFDGVARAVRFAPYVEGTVAVGFPEHLGPAIGMVLVLSTVLYLIPRTAILGAILLTGYLGGATATHVRMEDASFAFAAAFGVLVWVGLYLREPRLRHLLPVRRSIV